MFPNLIEAIKLIQSNVEKLKLCQQKSFLRFDVSDNTLFPKNNANSKKKTFFDCFQLNFKKQYLLGKNYAAAGEKNVDKASI